MRRIFMCPLWLHHIFRQLSHKRHDFRKKVTEMCILIFSATLFQIFLTSRSIQRDIVIMMRSSSCKVPVICQILMKLEFSQQIFEKKNTNVKYYQNPSSGSRVVPCGRTDVRKLIVVFRSVTILHT
jgi:hypothetical protein